MGQSILVVEDIEDSRRMMKFLLESNGYRVIEAATGTEAIERVREDPPELILMDLSMPGMDGLSATRWIKEIEHAVEIPVICVTAHASRYYQAAIEAGCEEVVEKPVDIDELTQLVSRYLAGGPEKP
jgi:CheY-like chemotaxis protein